MRPEQRVKAALEEPSPPVENPAPRMPYAGMWAALGIVVLQQLYAVPFLIPFFIMDAIRKTEWMKHPLTFAVAATLASILVVEQVRRAWKVSLREIAGPMVSRKKFLLGVACDLSLMTSLIGIIVALSRWSPWFAAQLDHVRMPFDDNHWLTFLPVVIVAPLCEEFVFRGLMTRAVLSRHREKTAVIAVAILFAGAHLDWVKMPGTFLAGLLFGWWYVQTCSIWMGVAGHATGNLATVALAWVAPWKGHQPWPPAVDVVMITAGAMLVAVIIREIRREFAISHARGIEEDQIA